MTDHADQTASTADLYRRAMAGFDARVARIRPDQWGAPTPCSEWDVRALVNHVAAENRWVPVLLAGATIEEVGDRFDGDVLGPDPALGWREAADDAIGAVADGGSLGATVKVSFGEIPASVYVGQVFADVLIHTWDLAAAIGAHPTLDPELVAVCHAMVAAMEDDLKASGQFGERIAPPPDADLQTRLLAIAGRRP